MTRDELLGLWKLATSERERADVEADLWGTATRAERDGYSSGKWTARTLGIPQRLAVARANLRFSGPAAAPLWERVDGPDRLALHAATTVLRRAKLRAAASATPLDAAVRAELAEYETWPLLRMADGTSYRKRPSRHRRGTAPSTASTNGTVDATRERWATVRAAVWRAVDGELLGVVDLRTRELLRSQVEAELSSLVALLGARIRREREASSLNGAAPPAPNGSGRRALRAACAVLSVDPPRTAARVDHETYRAAKKNYRALVREYHPDASGTEGTRERYQAVVEAMVAIERSYQGADGPPPVAVEEKEGDHDQHGN